MTEVQTTTETVTEEQPYKRTRYEDNYEVIDECFKVWETRFWFVCN